MKRATVKFDDLLEAFEFVSSGQPFEIEAYLCVETGEIYFHSELGDHFEADLPEDIEDAERYVVIPHKNDLGLGRRMALDFAHAELAEDLDDVYDIFRRKGAYSRFKSLLERRGKVPEWHAYEASRMKEALREWCVDSDIQVQG